MAYTTLCFVPRGQTCFRRSDFGASAGAGSRVLCPLVAGEPALQRAILLRNPYVDPMSFLQIDLLRRWRETNREDGELFKALLATVNGIAQGMQNTG